MSTRLSRDLSTSPLTGTHLRLLRSPLLADYIANTRLLARVGNARFATMIDEACPRGPLREARDRPHFSEPYVLVHSWLDGLLELSAGMAAAARRLTATPPAAWGAPDGPLARALKELGWLGDVPIDPARLTYRALSSFAAVQNQWELERLLEIVLERPPRTVVEIGTARGGTLYALMQAAQPGALIVSIDLPGAINCGGQTSDERALLGDLAQPTQRVEWVPGDSHCATTRRRLLNVLDGRPIDLLLIDGDHRYSGVRADLEDYGRLVDSRGLIAFHDICLLPDEWGPNAGVGMLWRQLRSAFPTVEIIDPHGTSRVQRGQRAWAWGIGLIRGGDWSGRLEEGALREVG